MTPEQEEEVRRALASVPAEPGLPPEVAARLDATLARLVAERDSGTATTGSGVPQPAGPARVDELEQRRRRRWPRVLVAAASVAVLGYGAGVVLDGLQASGGDASSTAARDETFAGAGAGQESADQVTPEAPGVMPPAGGTDSGSGGQAVSPQDAKSGRFDRARALSGRRVLLHSDTLAADVRRLLDRPVPLDAPRAATARERPAAKTVAPCVPPALGRSDRYAAARLDGTRATLVVRRGADGTRVAEVHSCDDPTRLLALTRLTPSR